MMCCIKHERVLCRAFGMVVLLAVAYGHVTEVSFKRIDNADMEELYSNTHQNYSVNSLATCSSLCSQNTNCRSYVWTSHASQCTLLPMDIKNDPFKPSVPQDFAIFTTFYRDCSEFGYEAVAGMSGHCFKNYIETQSYSDTQNICQSSAGNLVRIPTSTKHLAVLQFMILKSINEIYIDGTNIPSGSWLLSNGSPLFLNWRSGEPTGDSSENCVIMFDDGTYNDVFCNVMIPFICERQLNV